MTILFTSTAVPIGDFQVESFYEDNKHKRVIRIQNELVLHRFRLMVEKKLLSYFRYGSTRSTYSQKPRRVIEVGRD